MHLVIFIYSSTKFKSFPNVSLILIAAVKPVIITISPTIQAAVIYAFSSFDEKNTPLLKNLNRKEIGSKNPRTRLGIEMAAVARRFVPKLSALIVIYKTEIPEQKPNSTQKVYILTALPPPFKIKKQKMQTDSST